MCVQIMQICAHRGNGVNAREPSSGTRPGPDCSAPGCAEDSIPAAQTSDFCSVVRGVNMAGSCVRATLLEEPSDVLAVG